MFYFLVRIKVHRASAKVSSLHLFEVARLPAAIEGRSFRPVQAEIDEPALAGSGLRHSIEWRVVVGNERIELQRKIAQAVAVGPPQDPRREQKALPIAAGGRPIAPHLCGIEGQHGIDDIGERRPQSLVMQIPVGNPLDIFVADTLGELRHGLRAEITAVSHDGRNHLAHLVGGAGVPPPAGQEVAGPVEVIIHGNEELRQPDGRDFVPEPGPQSGQTGFVCRAEHLGRVRRQVPALLVDRDRCIGRQGDEEPIIGGVEALREPCRRVAGRHRQAGFPEEVLTPGGPRRVRQEEIVELAKARAAPNPDVAPLDLVPQGGQDGTFVGWRCCWSPQRRAGAWGDMYQAPARAGSGALWFGSAFSMPA